MKFINLPRHICNHLVGDDHHLGHRMIAGIAVMSVGVAVAKVGGSIHFFVIEYLADGIGYLIHGVGCIPFVEALIKKDN